MMEKKMTNTPKYIKQAVHITEIIIEIEDTITLTNEELEKMTKMIINQTDHHTIEWSKIEDQKKKYEKKV